MLVIKDLHSDISDQFWLFYGYKYNIYYSENDQPFVLWLPNTNKETATFKGNAETTFRFTVTARDKAGNRETFDENKTVEVTFKSN